MIDRDRKTNRQSNREKVQPGQTRKAQVGTRQYGVNFDSQSVTVIFRFSNLRRKSEIIVLFAKI